MDASGAHDLVHAPLARWAVERAAAAALSDGVRTLSFAALYTEVSRQAEALQAQRAPAVAWVDDQQPVLEQMVQFLAIVASGRCAAVGDPDWSAAVRRAARDSLPQAPCVMPPPTPETLFYAGFTSGSSGRPKGFMRTHRSWTESFRACVQTFGAPARQRVCAPGRPSHSLFLFSILLGVWSGAGAVVQDRFSAAGVLAQLQAQRLPCLVAVPSQLLLLLEWVQHRALAPVAGVELVLVSGARWPRQHTPALQACFPGAAIVEFYGASELSFVAWTPADPALPPDVVGRPFAGVEVQIRRVGHGGRHAPGASEAVAAAEAAAHAPEPGLIWVRSPMVFARYVDAAADASACLQENGWWSVRDMGYWDAQGRLCLAGRQSRLIVTQAKKLFAEELETLLQTHPALQRVSVHGVPDPLRGQAVVAVLQWRPGGRAGGEHGGPEARPSAAQLRAWCRSRVQPYKVPRQWFVCADWPMTPSGKTDHRALDALLGHALGAAPQAPQVPGGPPCLTRWP